MIKIRLMLLLAAGVSLTSAQNLQSAAKPGQFDSEQRLSWFMNASFGAASQFSSLTRAGIDTWRNVPEEYGPHWEGFAKRYGSGMTDRVISTGLEAGVGSLWHEDPRYFRVPERPFGGRIKNVILMSVISHDSSGHAMPAYARFVAVPSAAFIANAWRPDSQNESGDALNRIGMSFSTRILGNAFSEFWPDLKQRMFHRRHNQADSLDPAGNVR